MDMGIMPEHRQSNMGADDLVYQMSPIEKV